MMKNISRMTILGLASVLLALPSAWAVNRPEPESGGRYFPGKGTHAGAEYAEYVGDRVNASSSYGRTETSSFEDQRYADGLKLGALNMRPYLGYIGEYDSNIFLTEDDEDQDYISKLLGGVDAEVVVQDGKYVMTGGVQSFSEWFADQGSQNHSDWAYQLAAEAHWSGLDLRVYDEFRDTSARSSNDLTDRAQRYENLLGGLATLPFGQFFLETEVLDFIVNFDEDSGRQLFDRHEFSVYPRIGINVGSKSQLLLEYGYIDINYRNQDDRDGVANQAQLGMRGFLGESNLVSYQVWGGWQFRNYESDALKDFQGFIGHGEVSYQPVARTRFSLQAVRRPEESLNTGQSVYTRNEIGFRVRQQIAEQWFVNGRAGAGLNRYSSGRDDFLWEPSVGLEYILPGNIISLFAEYKFSARQSDTDNRDYNRHIANFGIKASL